MTSEKLETFCETPTASLSSLCPGCRPQILLDDVAKILFLYVLLLLGESQWKVMTNRRIAASLKDMRRRVGC